MSVPDIQDALDLLDRGETPQARSLLENLARLMPAYVTPHVLLAHVYEAEEQWDEARRAWQRARFLMPNSPAVAAGWRRALRLEGAVPFPTAFAAVDDETDFVDLTARTHSLMADMEERAKHGPSAEDAREEVLVADPAAEETVVIAETPQEGDDLDRLIEELESARITPRPDFEAIPPPELDDDIEDVVSETLARIYAAQGQFDEAARIYELLAAQHPEHAQAFEAEARSLRSKANAS